MANELQTLIPPILETATQIMDRHLSVGIEHFVSGNKIENLNVNIGANAAPPILTPNIEDRNFNRQYYNLFVCGELDIEHIQPFMVDIDRALNKRTDRAITAKFARLEDEGVKKEIYALPSIFSNENRHSGYADADQTVGFGYVKKLKVSRNQGKIQISPHVIYQLPQQRLNEALFELDLYGSSSCNEFNQPHWTIKQVDLIAKLIGMGFPL